jgi:tripartite-type tricarboxylate transporter receptor subunit TctC
MERVMKRKQAALTWAIVAFATLSIGAVAQAADTFPSGQIRIIVPVAAGGTVDQVARLVSKGLTEHLKQTVIVENRPGASSLLGTREVARAKPDGYTLLATSSTFIEAPLFVPDVKYDPFKDFEPVSQTANIPMVLVVNPSVPVHNVRELIAYAKARPGAVSMGSSGIGSTAYLASQLFARRAGITLLDVAYKGNSQIVTDLVGNQLTGMFDTTVSLAFIRAGKLRALAVSTTTRSPALPDVPTMVEAGLPGYEDEIFNAVFAPAGTPPAVVKVLHDAIVQTFSDPTTVKRLADQGVIVHYSAEPKDMTAVLHAAQIRYQAVAKMQPAQ